MTQPGLNQSKPNPNQQPSLLCNDVLPFYMNTHKHISTEATTSLDNLQPPPNVTHGIGNCFAILEVNPTIYFSQCG